MESLPLPRNRKKRNEIDPLLIIAGALIMIALALVIIYLTRDRSDVDASSAAANARPPAADFTLTSFSGPVSLSDFRGKYVLLNFWATWCPPCQAEMPTLNAYYLLHKNQNFVLLGVDVVEDAATVKTFLQANNISFPVVLDTTGTVSDRYGADALPVSFLVGPDGTLVKAWRPGALSRQMLDRDITPLLKG